MTGSAAGPAPGPRARAGDPAGRDLRLFVTTPPGVAHLLEQELTALGATALRRQGAGVACRADLEATYRIVLWSRLASRVLLEVAIFEAPDADALYRGALAVDWPGLFDLEATFAVRTTMVGSAIGHSAYAGQRVKDAIVDRFRADCGARPSVDRQAPDLRVHLYAQRRRATLALDLAGASLHRRGYRGADAAAPLKENLAAAILGFCDWPTIAAAGGTLLDPMCGSATLLTEGALMASNTAPGLLREHFGFEAWSGHRYGTWARVLAAARAARRPDHGVQFVGFDADPAAIAQARRAHEWLAASLGDPGRWHLEPASVTALTPPDDAPPGLLICNPPYGERLAPAELPSLYAALGRCLRRFGGWRAGVFSANADLMHRLRLPSEQRINLKNGALDSVLYDLGTIAGAGLVDEPPRRSAHTGEADPAGRAPAASGHRAVRAVQGPVSSSAGTGPGPGALAGGASASGHRPDAAAPPEAASLAARPRPDAGDRLAADATNPEATSPEATGAEATGADGEALANRLRKNLRRLGKWLRREHIECFRVYDADLPEFAFAIDCYRGSEPALVLQEYRAPANIDRAIAQTRARCLEQVAAEVLEVAPGRVFVKQRRRQRGTDQYERLSEASVTDVVEEGGLAFQVNFTDYLDTGLFLDHRGTRARIRATASGKHVLNLFAYTGSASVYAAAGGALTTTSVDLSHTYLEWARHNLALNGFQTENHSLVQADCLTWLKHTRGTYDLVFVDPPSFSNSKRMEESFDIQRDHPGLLHAAGRLLNPGGLLLFTSNRRRFKLDPGLTNRFSVRDITRQTRPPDYARARAPHSAFELTLR